MSKKFSDAEIHRRNIAIAKFTGHKVVGFVTEKHPVFPKTFRAFYEAKEIDDYEKRGYRSRLEYRSDWNVLMDAVEKINRTEHFRFAGTFNNLMIAPPFVYITLGENFDKEFQTKFNPEEEGSMLKAVWTTVSEFVLRHEKLKEPA